MNSLQSPQYSGSSKADLFSKQRSPSFRNKRIPSMQEHLCFSNQHLKFSKSESPSKLSQEIRRRKSQYADNQTVNHSNSKKKSKLINNSTRDLMSSIQDLKQQYKALRQAYKELIQQKIKNTDQMNHAKQENLSLKLQLEQFKKRQTQYQQEVDQLKMQNASLKSEVYQQRKKKLQLQTDLYFLKEKAQLQLNSSRLKNIQLDHNKETKRSLVGLENAQQIEEVHFTETNSNILSFSLTSVLEESVSQQKSCRKYDHVKVVSNLSNFNGQFDNVEIKPKKQSLGANFKKNKKQSVKLQFGFESKPLSNINPLSQLLSLKSPQAGDKKIFKNPNSSNSKRKKEDKENIEPKGKKKSKKILQINSPE